jgi:hypothetical protein
LSPNEVRSMSKVALAAAIALAFCAGAAAQTAAETELAQLVGDCNVMAGSRSAKRRNVQACETLANENQLTLVEPAAAAAYREYREERYQACLRRQASPRGGARGQGDCTP